MTSPLHLEQQRFGERPARSEDAAAIAALAADDARVLERLPPSTMAANIRAGIGRAEQAERSSSSLPARRLLQVAPVLAAAAVLAVVVMAPVDEGDRLKGLTPSLDVHVAAPAGPQPLRSGDVVGAGDVLQLRVRRADASHGVVVSVDGSGAVTRHFPDGADTALPTATASLPFSFELDDAPGYERFFLVTSSAPIDVDAVVRAASVLARKPGAETAVLALPTGLRQSDVLLRKRVPDATSTK